MQLHVRRIGTLAWLWSGRPDFLSISMTLPSGLLGRYTPTSTTILAISSSIFACGMRQERDLYPNMISRRTFFSGLVFLMYGLSLPEMEVTSWKNPNSRS